MFNRTEIEQIKEIAKKQASMPSSTVLILAEEVEALLKLLKSLEYTEDSGRIGGAIYKFCPICGATQNHGKHDENCQLNNLLKLFD